MKIAFTICSNNYLSQAKTLGDSLLKHNLDYTFIIGLCDKKNELVDYSVYMPHSIIELSDINIPNIEWMIYNYNIIELNTATKPYYFQHIMQSYTDDVMSIMYFDPDIKILNNLSAIEDELKDRTCLLTPHILTPIAYDNNLPTENVFLNYGLYNLGFLAINVCAEAKKMIAWWAQKLAFQSISRVSEGLFVDQLPMNFAPIFFQNVQISHNVGFNFAYWNMHERIISIKDDKYWVNGNTQLTFFHFSNFKPTYPLGITPKQTRFTLSEGTPLHILYDEYAQDLLRNSFFDLIDIKCHYVSLREDKDNEELRKKELKNKEKAEELHKLNSKLTVRIKRKAKKIFEAIFK